MRVALLTPRRHLLSYPIQKLTWGLQIKSSRRAMDRADDYRDRPANNSHDRWVSLPKGIECFDKQPRYGELQVFNRYRIAATGVSDDHLLAPNRSNSRWADCAKHHPLRTLKSEFPRSKVCPTNERIDSILRSAACSGSARVANLTACHWARLCE